MDPELARKRLQDLLADLDRSAASLREEHPDDISEELADYDQHPADSGSNISESDRVAALLAAAERRRGQVQAALERIEHGTYGVCLDCGRPLSDERLEARPEAARCVDCQTKHEARQ